MLAGDITQIDTQGICGRALLRPHRSHTQCDNSFRIFNSSPNPRIQKQRVKGKCTMLFVGPGSYPPSNLCQISLIPLPCDLSSAPQLNLSMVGCLKQPRPQSSKTTKPEMASADCALDGDTRCLHVAVHGGHCGIVEKLLQHDVTKFSVNMACTAKGWFPLFLASRKGHESIVQRLLKESLAKV
eukprot:3288679-Amphidinium_carterae.2